MKHTLTKNLTEPKELIESLITAFAGLSQIPFNVFILATVGQLNNRQNGFNHNKQGAIDEYVSRVYGEISAYFADRDWEMPMGKQEFHAQVNKGFWELNAR